MRERALFRVAKYLLFLSILVLLHQPDANATSPDQLSYCGGLDQRACCIFEASPSCDGSYFEEIGGATCTDGVLTFTTGICRSNNPNDKSFCGGNGQRACCLGEALPSCDTGNIELIFKGGVCGAGATSPGSDAGTCWTPTPCGGEGQRACSVGERIPSCNSGLIEMPGCSGIDCGPSSGWCYKPTACGGEGQRACCFLERGADSCDPGLTQIAGVTGDATCGAIAIPFPTASLGTCFDMSKLKDPIAEPATGWSSAGSEDPTCQSKGYADLHVHMFAHLAHGGGVLSGKPYDQAGGINKALRMDYGTDLDLVKKDGAELIDPVGCDPDVMPFCGDRLFHGAHLITDDAVGVGTHEGPPECLGVLCGAGSDFGSPLFNGWPTFRSTIHQQVYFKWLERAWRGGLRLMGQLAVTNEALCTGSKHLRDTDCTNEMAPVDAQIQATYDFQAYVDSISGGAGMGWFRIVKTPAEARQVISDGKLAVVIGIEVANLFNCKKNGCSGKLDGETDEVYVKRKVDEYYDKGVRIIFPIHNFDNAFGGPATWQNAINAGNYVSEGGFWNPEDCGDDPYGFKIGAFSSWIIELLGFGIFDVVPPQEGDTSCNTRGLTDLGKTLVKYMMQKGIIVDVDHLSNKAFDDTLDIANTENRPVIASHVQFFDLNKQEERHERMRTAEQLERIRNSGGMVAAMLKDDAADTDNVVGKFNQAYVNSPTGKIIKDDCRYSSKTWAQMYQYAVDKMQGPVAMGSDFNGIAGHVGPRFGLDACGQDLAERSAQARAGNKLQYPFVLPGFGTFEKQKTGFRTFDYNVDGLAHIGLLPDLVADLKKIGLTDTDLDPLMNSASGVVDVWDKANGTVVPPNGLTQLGCESKTVSADSNCQASGISVANADTLANFGANLTQSPAAPYALGQTSVTLSTTQADECGAQPASCIGTVTVKDTTAPSITCPQTTTAECQGAATNVTFDAATVGNDNCGSSFYAGCTSASGTDFLKGSTQVTCFSYDDAFQDAFGNGVPNLSSCNFDVNVVDTTKPTITCPGNITTECTGNSSAQATPGAATASDVCAGVQVTTHDPASFPLGETTLTYTATDEANLTASCDSKVTVQDTTSPEITCPATITAECTGNHSATVTPAAATGSDICAPVTITKPGTASFPLGTTTLTYTATDGVGLSKSCNSSIVVQDTTAPTITSVAVTPTVLETLWPPSHKMKTVTLAVTTSDVCDTGVASPVCQISEITSNEPINGLGDGDMAPDWEILGPLQANLRAERSGTGNGRIYTLKVSCKDQQNNVSTGSTIVTVPKSQ